MPILPPLRTGVYCIRNRRNGKVYVGSATRSFQLRWAEHRKALIAGRHVNKHLQGAWNISGGDVFEFVILGMYLPQDCIRWEQHWMDWYCSYDSELGYNARPKAENNLGKKFGPRSDDAKAKTSETLKRIYPSGRSCSHSEETRAKISAANRARELSEEARSNISLAAKARKGYRHTKDARDKMSSTRRERISSGEIVITGHPMTNKTRVALALAHKGKALTTNHRTKLAIAKLGRSWSLARRMACQAKKSRT